MSEVASGPAPTRRAQTYADGDWHRLHPLTPVLRGGLAVAAIAGVFLATVWDQALTAFSSYLVYQEIPDTDIGELPPLPFGGSLLVGTGLILLVAALGAGWLWLTWFMHTVRIDDEVIEVRDGVLFRTHRRARRDRINSVAIWRPLIPRLLGVSKLEFQAAGSDANVSLSYLAYPVATELRRIVVQSEHTHGTTAAEANSSESGSAYGSVHKSEDDNTAHHEPLPGQTGSTPGAEPEVTRHVEVPLGRLLGSLVVSLETFFFVLTFAVIIGGFVITGDLEWWIGAFPAALVYVVAIARGWTRASQFRLETVGDSVRVSYGLLSTTSASIPPDKVHALHISQPWPWRFFGWWRVEIHRAITPGQSQTNQGPSHQMVLPVGHLD
ncbi:PH domain-containing protein, partial [Pontimonas sp.]|uniref:PH domain-containing protein n=1 Tax=Pontimonas sp. TaxID=2304492 RepID=UPI00286FC042